MVNIYESCFKVIKFVVKGKTQFSTAVRKLGNEIEKKYTKEINALSGTYLRNFYFIKALSRLAFGVEDEDSEATIYIGLAFVDIVYKKINEKPEIYKFLASKLALYQVKFGDEEKKLFEEACESKETFLKAHYESKGIEAGYKYLSAKHNLPVWVIKSLLKQYPKNTSIKAIGAMTKMPYQFVTVNNLILKEYPNGLFDDFKEVAENLYMYQLNSSIRKNNFVRVAELVPLQKAEYIFGHSLPLISDGSVTFYFEERASLYPVLADRYIKNNKLVLLTDNKKSNVDLFTKVGGKVENANFELYESTRGEIIAHIPENSQDLFVFMPKSTNMEQLRRLPEYGIIFDENSMDEIFKNEKEGLIDAKHYVKKDGYLAYAVATLNLKETLLVAQTFVANNRDFILEKEKIFFPNEKENSVFYFALFRKVK